MGLALFLAVASGPRFFRLCTVAPPAILICTWIISLQARAFRLVRNLLWALAIAFAILLAFHRQTQWHATLDLPIGRIAQVTAVIQSLRQRPPRFVMIFPQTSDFFAVHDHSGPFRKYVHDNYHLDQTFYLNRNSRYEELWEIGPVTADPSQR